MVTPAPEECILFLCSIGLITTIPHLTIPKNGMIMDRLDELTVLVTIVDEGSLAAAARRLRRSPPAITRVLAALERRAGARLLERTTRHLAPTETGRTLAARARTLLADYAGALSDLDSAPIRGLIRVAAPVQFGRLHMSGV